MNINDYLLQDWCNADAFTLWFTIIFQILIGFLLGLIFTLKADLGDYYRKGQIDALNGKIKYKKKENDNKELVWMEIPKSK